MATTKVSIPETQTAPMIYRLIPKIMASVGAIGKNRQSGGGNSRAPKYAFRGIDDMYNQIQPAFIEHGVFVVPRVISQRREERKTTSGGSMIYTILKVKHTFYAQDGSSIEAITVGEAFDTSDKSSNKAMSAAMKYAMIEVFCIPTEGDNDTEGNHLEPAPREPATREPASKLAELITKHNVSKELVSKWMSQAGIERIEDMPSAPAEACIAYIENRVRKASEKPAP